MSWGWAVHWRFSVCCVFSSGRICPEPILHGLPWSPRMGGWRRCWAWSWPWARRAVCAGCEASIHVKINIPPSTGSWHLRTGENPLEGDWIPPQPSEAAVAEQACRTGSGLGSMVEGGAPLLLATRAKLLCEPGAHLSSRCLSAPPG